MDEAAGTTRPACFRSRIAFTAFAVFHPDPLAFGFFGLAYSHLPNVLGDGPQAFIADAFAVIGGPICVG